MSKKKQNKTATHRCNLNLKELAKLDELRPFWKEEIEFIPPEVDEATEEFIKIVEFNKKEIENQMKLDLN